MLTTDPVQPTVETVAAVCLGGTVLGAGHLLRESDLPEEDLWRIAVWVSLGIILLVGLTAWQLLTQVRGGVELRNPVLSLLVTQSVGATAGLLVGIYHTRSLHHARAAQEATAAADEARAVQDQLSFVHTLVRHHLRNGMQVIQSYTQRLEPHVDPDGTRHLDTIQRRSQRLIRLVENMQPLARAVEPGDRLEATDVTTVLQREASNVEVTRPSVTIELRAPARSVAVRADSLLPAVFENLLRSAIERSGVRGPTTTATVERSDGSARITIATSGPAVDGGIDQRFRTAAESPVTAVDDVDLYIAEELVERYDGSLTVDQRSGGPRFVVELPLAET